jgi:hypothetical protein
MLIAARSSRLAGIIGQATAPVSLLYPAGLDPDNVTYDVIFNRLLEIFLANITFANICALIGATFFVATLLTRTMVPLRVSNMISNVFLWLSARSPATSKRFSYLCYYCQ